MVFVPTARVARAGETNNLGRSIEKSEFSMIEIVSVNIITRRSMESRLKTSERARFDSSRKWNKLCKVIWDRENATCQRCKVRFNHTQRTYEVHHVVPFRVESLRYEPTNLVLLCDPCHIWVHSRANTSKIFISLPS